MSAVWMRARAELRRGWPGIVAIGLLFGIAGGVVLTAAAGARRTASAFSRLLAATDAADVMISPANTGGGGYYDAVRALPSVAEAGVMGGYIFFAQSDITQPILAYVSQDNIFPYEVAQPKLLSGRMPAKDRPNEMLGNLFLAQSLHVRAGDLLKTYFFPQDRPIPQDEVPPRIDLTITGIGVFPNEVEPTAKNDSFPALYANKAFYDLHPGQGGFEGMLIRLKPGTNVAAFREELRDVARGRLKEIGALDVFFQDLDQRNAKVERAIRPQAVALAVFAALAALSSLLVLGQVLSRQVQLAASDHPTLRALGMGRWHLMMFAVARAGLVSCIAVVVALGIAIPASSTMPIGPARLAEPVVGISVDLLVLGVGVALLTLLVVARAVFSTWRSTASTARFGADVPFGGRARPSAIAAAVARFTRSPSASTGVRMALEPGRGRTAVPVRSAIAGAAIALASIVASFVFASNLDHLVSTKSAYGWSWDVQFDASFGAFAPALADKVLARDPDVAAYAGGLYGDDVVIAGVPVPTIAIQRFKGTVYPTLLDGEPALATGQIVLGTRTMHQLGVSIGDTVKASVNSKARSFKVVGRAIFPALGKGGFEPTGLGEGAAVTVEELAGGYINPADRDLHAEGGYNFLLVRMEPGRDVGAVGARLGDAMAKDHPTACEEEVRCGLTFDSKPADIENYAAVRATPVVLAGLLTLLALATVGHTLVTSIRRRRRDLAILKTLGFVRGQVSSSVAVQASTFGVVALVIGTPLGIVVGRWAWTLFANGLGVEASAATPLLAWITVIPATLLLANIIAAFPARAAARTQPAVVLRSE